MWFVTSNSLKPSRLSRDPFFGSTLLNLTGPCSAHPSAIPLGTARAMAKRYSSSATCRAHNALHRHQGRNSQDQCPRQMWKASMESRKVASRVASCMHSTFDTTKLLSFKRLNGLMENSGNFTAVCRFCFDDRHMTLCGNACRACEGGLQHGQICRGAPPSRFSNYFGTVSIDALALVLSFFYTSFTCIILHLQHMYFSLLLSLLLLLLLVLLLLLLLLLLMLLLLLLFLLLVACCLLLLLLLLWWFLLLVACGCCCCCWCCCCCGCGCRCGCLCGCRCGCRRCRCRCCCCHVVLFAVIVVIVGHEWLQVLKSKSSVELARFRIVSVAFSEYFTSKPFCFPSTELRVHHTARAW